MKALAHRREDRYETAADMAAALEAAIDALNEKGSPRDTGKLIESFFAGERAKIKALVEAQAAEVRAVQEPSTFDPRLSGSGLKLPHFDDHATVEPVSGSGQHDHGSGSGSGRVDRPSGPSTLTAATASAPGSPPVSQAPGKGRIYAAIAAAAVGAVVTVAVIASRSGGSAAAAPTPTGAPTAIADTAPKTHSVAVDSTPQGATVREGEKTLGTTPMTLEIDLSGPARKFVISLDGFTPHTFIPTREDTRITVPLVSAAVPEKAAAPDKPAKTITRVVVVPATPPATPPVRPPPPSDINTAR
jgi:hypothetical protein